MDKNKIIIKIINKKGIISNFRINKKNKINYKYNRTKKAYEKLSIEKIKEIKKIERFKKERQKLKRFEKRKEKRLKKESEREVKKQKKEFIEKKLKEKKIKNCEFNYKDYYSGINHDGYVRIKDMTFTIDNEITNSEIIELEQIIKNFVKDAYENLQCPQRQMYLKIHYLVQKSNISDDLYASSNSTNISFNIKSLFNQIDELISVILSILNSYSLIIITRLEFVNFEFVAILNKKEVN